jgi:hypothetical protein
VIDKLAKTSISLKFIKLGDIIGKTTERFFVGFSLRRDLTTGEKLILGRSLILQRQGCLQRHGDQLGEGGQVPDRAGWSSGGIIRSCS